MCLGWSVQRVLYGLVGIVRATDSPQHNMQALHLLRGRTTSRALSELQRRHLTPLLRWARP